MRKIILTLLSSLALTACTTQPRTPIATAPPVPVSEQPADLADLVKAVDIPYETFILPNGLTTLIHTDRKAPIVGVTVYYRVGSKHEPRGRTGFAHLYEHIFFGGSENVPNFDVPLEGAGSTPTNGTTWYDRTNYVETVPTGALDLALFMESDRMGHLLGALTQEKLDKQRGVVQNEKRQNDNEPYGLADYAIGDGLFPVGHPYRHSTIGSMADLDAASLEDVRQWFRDNYGPNNAVLVLSGDIDTATARPMVEKWFGAIPRGPDIAKVDAAPVTLPAARSREMADRVPLIRVSRNWSGPGLNDPDAVALDLGMRVLGGLSSSRLENELVRSKQLATGVSAMALTFEQTSMIMATMNIKPGADRTAAEAAFDAAIARFIAEGPSEDELRRAAALAISAQVGALEQVGGFYGKGATLAEGQLFSGDPAKYKADLARIAAITSQDVRLAMQRWLTRPAFSLAIVPGQRTERGETMGGWGDETAPAPKPKLRKPAAPKVVPGPKRIAPPATSPGDLVFPQVAHFTLSNGIPIALARRTAVPKAIIQLEFDAGFAADALDKPGTQSLMLEMLDEGTAGPRGSRTGTQIAEEQERLGAQIEIGGSLDASSVTLNALTANLAPSLGLMAELVRYPSFEPKEVARVRDQQLASLSEALATPGPIAGRALGKTLYGTHPYAQPGDGLGHAGTLGSLTPEALRAAHRKWLRPDLARITVVGDVAMEQLRPLLEAAFGAWQAPPEARPVKDLTAPLPSPRPRIILIDRPNSPQSVIMAGRVLPITGRDQGKEALELANEVLGNGFLSRLNLDLREDKSWTYGVRSSAGTAQGPRSFTVATSVQADRTGDSIRAIRAQIAAFPATRPVDAQELNRVTEGNIRGLPNRYETNAQVLGALVSNARLARPDTYQSTLASRLRTIDAKTINEAARNYLHGDGLTFVVVGERKLVEPQLKGLGLPVEIAPATDAGH